MGRIKSKWIKNIAVILIEKYPGKFNNDFNNNKNVLHQMNIVSGKFTRNKLAGYLSKVVGRSQI